MSAAILDGAALAQTIKESLRPRIAAVEKRLGRPPGLLVVASETPDRASKAYRHSQMKAALSLGIHAFEYAAAAHSAKDLLSLILQKPQYDGVVFDLPLPGVEIDALLAALPPERDAEGASPFNFGKLFEIKRYDELQARGLVAPCTALAVAELLRSSNAPLAGKTAVVLGRSNIVGKPAAHLLTCLDLTVTLCHSRTRDLQKIVAQADVVVAAMGKAKMVGADWIKPGAIVIDAGINAEGKTLVGDVDPAAAARASFYTPVPGGVGPVTTAMLLANTVALAERR